MAVELKENDLFQTIFNSSAEGIIVVDNDGALLKVNPAAERMFGYDQGELINCQLESLIPEKFRNKHIEHRGNYTKKLISLPMRRNIDLWGLKKNGTQFPVEISLSPSVLEGKSITTAFVWDLTKREQNSIALKKADIDLARSSRKYGSLIESLQGVVYRCKNNRTFTMEHIDEGCLAITGYTFDAFIGKKISFGKIILDEDKEYVWNSVQEALKKEKAFNIQFRIRHKNGTTRHVWEHGEAIFDSKGKVMAIEGFLMDITLRMAMQQELKDKEAKNKALLEAIPDMMVIQNYAGDIIDFYAPEETKLQIPRVEIIGRNIKEVVPPSMSKSILKAHNKVIKTNKIQIKEYSLNGQNGKKDYEARTVQLNDHRLLTIVRDITKRENAKKELKASESKNRALLEAIPDMMFILSNEGEYLAVYAPKPKKLLVHKEDLIGKNIKDILPANAYRSIHLALNQVVKTKKTKITEYYLHQKGQYYEARIVWMNSHNLLSIIRDVTKTKTTENVLRIRNRALEAAGNGILIADAQLPDNPIIYCNDAFSQNTGYDKSEVMGRNPRFLHNHDRDQKDIDLMREAIREGWPCNATLRNYRKDGTLFWNEVTITPVYNDQGLLTHFIGVQNDVTMRKKEELLKDQIRKILEMIAQHWPLDFIGNAIVETVEQNIENCLASILLLDREKGTLHNLSAPNLPKSLTQTLDGMKIGPNICSCSTAVHLKKEVFTTDMTKDPLWKGHRNLLMEHNLKSSWSLPILSSSQEVLGILALYNEQPTEPGKSQREMIEYINFLSSVAIEQHNTRITLHENRKQLASYAHELEGQVEERTNELKATVQKLVETNLNLEDQVLDTKAAENRAMASQAMFTAIARNFPKGVIIVFNTDFDIVYIDGGELYRMGLNKTEIEGTNIDDTDIFSEQRIEQIKENIKKTMDGEHLSFEIQFRRRSYSVNTSPLYDDNDKIKWTLFVYNDITKQKQAERSIRSALVREQELNELKSRFISMASHEFRTPLSAILSSAILIGKQNEPGKEVKREKYVGQIKTNVRNLVVILNDFLSLSKLEEGKVTAHKEKFDIVQFSKSLVDEIDSSKKYGQKIAIKHKKPTINVLLDPKLTRHILTNLLSNAIKYSQENKNIDLILDKNQENLVIKVIDQGIGIPKEEQSNLFQRFFRSDNSSAIQGTGLGLHIVKQYAELMGGHVSFKSELNKGSTFIVELPT